VLDEEPLDVASGSCGDAIYDPNAILALIYTSGTTGRPKGVALSHANVLENVHFLNYWMPYKEGTVYLHAAPMFHIIDFPLLFAAPAFGTYQVTIPKFSAQSFCEAVEREGVTHTVLVPTMINLLTQFPELEKYDLTSLERMAYGGSPMAPELIRRTRAVLPHVRLVQGYGLSETGFLTALLDNEHTPDKLTSCGALVPGSTCGSWTSQEQKFRPVSLANWWLGARMSCVAIGIIRRKPLLRSGTASFVRETSAVRMRTVISTSWTA
jgi:long-chain acyl-CoA synthetase